MSRYRIKPKRKGRKFHSFPAINARDYKKELYNRFRAHDMKRKWKNPKAGLRRKRYYVKN